MSRRAHNFTDISNQKFNFLTVLGFVNIIKSGKKNVLWLCACECGKKIKVTGYKLRNGHTKSCGCKKGLFTRNSKRTHGMSKTHFYKKWTSMRKRCNNPKSENYSRYGGKGVTYSESWEKFENFYKDMYKSYQKHIQLYGKKQTTLDRIDNDKGYEKVNCRWATYEQQGNNTSRNKMLTYKGRTQSLSQWCKEYGYNYNTIRSRIHSGWDDFEKIFEMK